MQFGPQGKPPVGTVFDCDMGNSIDDALALAMLFGLQGKNETRLISLTVTKPNLNSAAFADAVRVAVCLLHADALVPGPEVRRGTT